MVFLAVARVVVVLVAPVAQREEHSDSTTMLLLTPEPQRDKMEIMGRLFLVMGPELVVVVAQVRIPQRLLMVGMVVTLEIMELVAVGVAPLKTDLILGKVGMVVVDVLMQLRFFK
jgi:hypothetical protein